MYSSSAQDRVNQEWNAMADDWDDLAAPYARSFYQMLLPVIESLSNKQLVVLDFGCGTGLLAELLQQHCAHIYCYDAASKMMDAVRDKLKAREWNNVHALHSSTGNPCPLQHELLFGNCDLVVASSVFTCVPPSDRNATLRLLGNCLQPGGVLVHSDWPLCVEHPDGLTREQCAELHTAAGLQTKRIEFESFAMGGSRTATVLVGIAEKSIERDCMY
jgi:SAM-dependent methyltransferase